MKNRIPLFTLLTALAAVLFLTDPALADVKATPRGVLIETPRLRVEIADGAVVELLNKLTNESYLRPNANPGDVIARVPGGLGTVSGEPARQAAATLFQWPWNEMAEGFKLPCQHAPNAKSAVEFKPAGTGGTLTYTSLGSGDATFADERFEVQVEVDAETGDVLLTAAASSPRTGVYGATIPFAPTRRLISIETPIFDGVRLTGDMKTNLWVNQSPSHWDYPLIAFNGENVGAIGLWAQDEQRRYKSLFYQADGAGITTAVCAMENPPFFGLKSSKSVAWRLQAFEKGWPEVAERYRQWRDKTLKIAPRAEWTKHLSFVNSGVNTSAGWLAALQAYLENRHADRTVTFLPVIRAASFDTKHYDNQPYAKFKEETPAWRAAGAHTMAYLQPMIMWGPFPDTMTAEEKKVVELSHAAETRSAFDQPPKKQDYIDQHHLGHAGWQAWFLACVKHYIQDCGADGIYHDQSYAIPIDGRGLINGMNAPQGMADYFYKAAVQNPGSIHGSEHLQEANITGASLGIGSGILWGTAPTMRMQRIRHGSPISNALHYPHGTIFGFPHYSDLGTRNDAHLFHWGIDLMERRGDIAGLALQNQVYNGKPVPFDKWTNEAQLDRSRSMNFLDMGLRPIYPLDWARQVRTYFRGAEGQDVRYEDTGFGSEFVEYKNSQRRVINGRITGVTHAATPLNVAGWIFYNDQGPSGLNPDRYYVTSPDAKRPAAHFSPGFSAVPGAPIHPTLYESYVEEGFGNDQFLSLSVRPLASVGKIISYDKVILHAAAPPAAVFVNGQAVKPEPRGEGRFEIGFATPADIVVFLKPPQPGLDNLAARVLARSLSSTGSELIDSSWLSQQVKTDEKIKSPNVRNALAGGAPGVVKNQLHVPLIVGGDKPETYNLKLPPGSAVSLNGQPQTVIGNLFAITLKPNQPTLLSITSASPASAVFETPVPPVEAAKPAPVAPPAPVKSTASPTTKPATTAPAK